MNLTKSLCRVCLVLVAFRWAEVECADCDQSSALAGVAAAV